jgi:hypothetical protein
MLGELGNIREAYLRIYHAAKLEVFASLNADYIPIVK